MVNPITGRRAGQMNGQEAAGSGSPRRRGPGTSLEPKRPIWEPSDRADRDTGDSRESGSRWASEDRWVSERAGISEQPGEPSSDRQGSGRRGSGRRGSGRQGSGWSVPSPSSSGWSAPNRPDPNRPDPNRPDPNRPGQSPPRQPGQAQSGTILPVQRSRISHLARDSRMPAWRRRLIIAVALGVVVTILTDWRLGLTVAVLAGIFDAVIRSRSSAASTAEGLTTGAQRRTKRELAKLERSGYKALHMRAIPGSNEVIDHLLIGPTGVYAIDSEQWDKRLPVRTKNARQLWHGPFSQQHRLQHARWEAAQATRLLSDALGEQLVVRPAMAVYGPAIPWGVATIRDVDVFSGDRLRKYLRRHPSGARAPRLSASEVQRIYATADRVLRPKQ